MIGDPTTLTCLINYIVFRLAGRDSRHLKRHQESLERAYYENDILFNIDKKPGEEVRQR